MATGFKLGNFGLTNCLSISLKVKASPVSVKDFSTSSENNFSNKFSSLLLKKGSAAAVEIFDLLIKSMLRRRRSDVTPTQIKFDLF